MRISDWSSDVCSSDLLVAFIRTLEASASDDVIDLFDAVSTKMFSNARVNAKEARMRSLRDLDAASLRLRDVGAVLLDDSIGDTEVRAAVFALVDRAALTEAVAQVNLLARPTRSEEHTSELQSLMRISYAVFCLQKKK